MTPQDLIAIVAGLFILGMIWLRTRMPYTRRYPGSLRLTRAGRLYFAAAVVLLVLGGVVAPAFARIGAPAAAASSTMVRVVWFLVLYYLFIGVHRYLQARKVDVFGPSSGPAP